MVDDYGHRDRSLWICKYLFLYVINVYFGIQIEKIYRNIDISLWNANDGGSA